MNNQLLITGETTGLIEMTLKEIFVDDTITNSVKKGDEVTFVTPELVRRNDKVYLVENVV